MSSASSLSMLFLAGYCSLFVSLASSEPVVSGIALKSAVQESSRSAARSSRPPLTKCQSDYLAALVHRCMLRGPGGEARICFADELGLEDVHELVGYISEMCCLLRCQAKTLERLCCRTAQQGRCRKANCLPIRGHEVLWSAEGASPTLIHQGEEAENGWLDQ